MDGMRKVSILRMEDPVDLMLQSADTKPSRNPEQQPQQRLSTRPRTRARASARGNGGAAAAAIAAASPELDGLHVSKRHSDHGPSSSLRKAMMTDARLKRPEPDRSRMQRRTKSHESKEFIPPTMLNGQLSYSDLTGKKSQLQYRPNKPRSRSLDDEDFFLDQFEPPEPLERRVTMPLHSNHNNKGGDVEQSGVVVPPPVTGIQFQVIEPTKEQRQLMRQVSALGLEDPVFGNIHESTRPSHPSNIFEDMDLKDVPDDMKDVLSIASDRTDPVDYDPRKFLDSPMQQESLETKATAEESTSKQSLSSSPQIRGFVPPNGSFVRRHSFRNDMKDMGPDILAPLAADSPGATAPRSLRSLHHGRAPDAPHMVDSPTLPKSIRSSNMDSAKSAKSSKSESLSGSKGSDEKASNRRAYVPPTGSFAWRQKRERSHTVGSHTAPREKDVLLHDLDKAAQLDAIFPGGSTFQADTLSQVDLQDGDALQISFSNLGASLSNFNSSHSNFNSSLSNFNDSSSRLQGSNRSKQRNMSRRFSGSGHEDVYKPPAAPTTRVSEDDTSHRLLPDSMDAIFSPSTGKERKKGNMSTPSVSNKKVTSRPPIDPSKAAQKQNSTRSWDGDLGEPIDEAACDPLWKSMAKLGDVYTSLEDAPSWKPPSFSKKKSSKPRSGRTVGRESSNPRVEDKSSP